MLEEITQRLGRGVLSRSECLEVAYRLHLDESALDAALIYLDDLSLIFYYPDILPNVIFSNPQVVVDKISELVKVHHDNVKKFSGEEWQIFFSHALVSIAFLSQAEFKKHFVSGLFEPEHLVILYRKLLVFADFSEGKFFVPCLLRMLSNHEISCYRVSNDSLVAPLVLHFRDGPPRRGIFCALTSFLTSPENHFPGPWSLKMPGRSVTPTCLHRNCIQFSIPGFKTACSITLIDTFLHFEVHFNIISTSQKEASKYCPIVKQAVFAGLRRAILNLGYTDCIPSVALLCPCGKGSPHPAAIGDGFWICSLDAGVGGTLSSNMLIWLEDYMPEASKETSDVTSDLKYFSAIEHVSSQIANMRSQCDAEIETLLEEKKQILQQLDQEPRSKLESGLPGVDVDGEASLIVTNEAQQFEWKKFGLKLTIPGGVLPPGVKQCQLLIKASTSGHYQLPDNYQLVSPFFWVRSKPHCKSFAKAITVEIEHCALDQNIPRLSCVKALCTQKEVPYSFEVTPGGKFSESSSHGLIKLNSFSGFGAAQKGSKKRRCCARLFYVTHSVHDRQVHFTVTWDTSAHRKRTEEYYSGLNATPGPDQEIVFEADTITLEIPEGDGSWRIVPHMTPQVTREQVDKFKKGRRIPHCSLQLVKLRSTWTTEVYRMNLKGTMDDSYFVFRVTPDGLSESISQNPGAYVDQPSHCTYLISRLTDKAAKWKIIGCYLGFSQDQLDIIENRPTLIPTGPVSFLQELLTQWLQRGNATLQTLKYALNQSGLGALSHEMVVPPLES